MESDSSSFFISNILLFIATNLFDYVYYALLLILTIANVIISAAEIAFFSLAQNDLDDLRDSSRSREKLTIKLVEDSNILLSSISIAHLFLNVVIFTLAFILLHKAKPDGFGLTDPAIVVVILLYILIFVEIIPKLYVSGRAKNIAVWATPFVNIIRKINYPVAKLLSAIPSNAIIHRHHDLSMDELSKALQMTSRNNEHEEEKDMLEEIIRFKDTIVDDIKVSRSDMVAIDISLPFKKVIDFIIDAGYSRIPVYENDSDNIKGILYVKDLLPYLNRTDNFRWQSLIRPAYFVPGTKRIEDLLEEFRTNKNHMAIVVDEYGATTGIVTMEDILEEIVGDISDEYDVEPSFYTLAPDGSYLFDGKTPLEDFFQITGLSEDEFEEYTNESDTLAGFILELHGNFPKRKEIITFKNYQFQIEELTKRRIVKVRFIPPNGKKA